MLRCATKGKGPSSAGAKANPVKDDLDEAQTATWVKQAAALPGWVL